MSQKSNVATLNSSPRSNYFVLDKLYEIINIIHRPC